MKKVILSAMMVCCYIVLLQGQLFYADVAAQVGIQHSYFGTIGGGVSFCDFNNDGLDDLTIATGTGEEIHFYLNNGDGFEKINALVPHQGEAKQILWVDFDNDGDKDLFIANYAGANRLYQNTGSLNFIDITEIAGLPLNDHNTFGACFGDIDRDGWLDLYFSERIPFMTSQNQHRLFKNNADGTFSEVTESSQTADPGKVPFCSAFFDYNNDKWPDIYTANDKINIPNTLLENNGDGTFSDVSIAANADMKMDAMCVNPGDYNNDGWTDIYITNTPVGSALLHNLGASSGSQVKFGNAAQFAGVGFYGGIGWGSVFLDADNDGDLDLYVSGAEDGANAVSSAFYLNNGNNVFSEPDVGFIGDTTKSYNNAIGDFNDDGFVDIGVLNIEPYFFQLWQNAGTSHHWLKIKLEGVLSNRDAIGARIEIYSDGYYQMRYTHCGNGFLGQNSNTEIIGLRNSEKADSIIITWPTGHIDKIYNQDADQKITILEGSSTNGLIAVDPGVEIKIIVSAGKEKFSKKEDVLLYPDPASTILNVSLNDMAADTYALFSEKGQLLNYTKITETDFSIDIHYLPAGKYFLVIENEGKRIIKKWIKI